LFADMFSFSPTDVEPEYRERLAAIHRKRAEYLHAQAEIADLRARTWSGETGLEGITDLKGADIAKIRQEFVENFSSLLKEAVNVEGLLSMLPMVAMGVLQNLKVPLPTLMEAAGADFDQLKLLVEQLKDFIEEMQS
jgi:hypothetical protein